MNNYLFPYLLIMLHFISGAIFIHVINHKLDADSSKQQWIKFFTYVLLFNLLWNSLIYLDAFFLVLGYTLMILCFLEWWKAIKEKSGKIWLMLGFILVLAGFWRFLYLPDKKILYTFFIVILFDGSSQIAGQVFGRNALLPRISPNKTVEGLIGGILITLATVLLVKKQFASGWAELILMSMFVILFAFSGDLLASITKRRVGLDTFGRMLPGHGGFLDRFDSLILAGSAMFIFSYVKEFFG